MPPPSLADRPPVTVRPSRFKSPLVLEKFKTRELCCASIVSPGAPGPEPVIVSVSLITSSPEVKAMVPDVAAPEKTISSGPAALFARPIAARKLPGSASERLLTENTASRRRSSSVSTCNRRA